MKKLLFVALAAVGMTACVQNEELVVSKHSTEIAFANSYVGTASRVAEDPSTTTNTIEGFNVWAFMDNVNGTVFTGEEVTKGTNGWGYVNTQYWFPNHTYYFAALSPIGGNWSVDTANASTEGLGVVSFTNANGTEDLLYAEAKETTPDAAKLNTLGMEPVNMNFKHLLSKVKFTFKNGFTTENVKVTVTGVQMVAYQTATIDLAQATYNWAGHAGETTLAFGDVETLAATTSAEAAYERFTIPAGADATYKVTFNVAVKVGEQDAQTVTKEAVKPYAAAAGKNGDPGRRSPGTPAGFYCSGYAQNCF